MAYLNDMVNEMNNAREIKNSISTLALKNATNAIGNNFLDVINFSQNYEIFSYSCKHFVISTRPENSKYY